MYDVTALGELLIDFTENGISEQGNTLLEVNPGGAPCNVLSMLQKLDKHTAFIGKVGDDNFGHMLADAVEEQGIDISGLCFDKEVHTTLAFVHTYDDGDRDFSFYRKPGADVRLTIPEIDENLIRKAKIFHFGTLSMTDSEIRKSTEHALDIAKKAGCIISFDPNLREPLWKYLQHAWEAMAYGFAKCDILKISDNEIEFFTGVSDIREGVAKIKKAFPNIKLVCATLGKEGSIAFYKDLVVAGKPYMNPNTIETTGAGDTFMACVLNYVLEHDIDKMSETELGELLDFANRAASLITTRRGALKVMPTRAEINARVQKS